MVEHETSVPVRIAAIAALGALGTPGPEANKALLGTSKHPDARIAAAAQAALAALVKRSR